jgi:hypothetical protein
VREDLEGGIDSDLGSAAVAGLLHLISGVGSAIQSLMDGKAKQNVEPRWLEVFVKHRKRIEEISDFIPDEAFYSSEEFQTLLARAGTALDNA